LLVKKKKKGKGKTEGGRWCGEMIYHLGVAGAVESSKASALYCYCSGNGSGSGSGCVGKT
jgi:hypothetical protein